MGSKFDSLFNNILKSNRGSFMEAGRAGRLSATDLDLDLDDEDGLEPIVDLDDEVASEVEDMSEVDDDDMPVKRVSRKADIVADEDDEDNEDVETCEEECVEKSDDMDEDDEDKDEDEDVLKEARRRIARRRAILEAEEEAKKEETAKEAPAEETQTVESVLELVVSALEEVKGKKSDNADLIKEIDEFIKKTNEFKEKAAKLEAGENPEEKEEEKKEEEKPAEETPKEEEKPAEEEKKEETSKDSEKQSSIKEAYRMMMNGKSRLL